MESLQTSIDDTIYVNDTFHSKYCILFCIFRKIINVFLHLSYLYYGNNSRWTALVDITQCSTYMCFSSLFSYYNAMLSNNMLLSTFFSFSHNIEPNKMLFLWVIIVCFSFWILLYCLLYC